VSRETAGSSSVRGGKRSAMQVNPSRAAMSLSQPRGICRSLSMRARLLCQQEPCFSRRRSIFTIVSVLAALLVLILLFTIVSAPLWRWLTLCSCERPSCAPSGKPEPSNREHSPAPFRPRRQIRRQKISWGARQGRFLFWQRSSEQRKAPSVGCGPDEAKRCLEPAGGSFSCAARYRASTWRSLTLD
jgi:hypothetical protein